MYQIFFLIKLMTNLKTVVIAAIIVTVSFAILSFEGYSLNEIIAEELSEDKGYLFAEDAVITGMFDFSKGTEISRFEMFPQNTGFKAREKFAFTLECGMSCSRRGRMVRGASRRQVTRCCSRKDDNTFD